jgi:hypothetical protein
MRIALTTVAPPVLVIPAVMIAIIVSVVRLAIARSQPEDQHPQQQSGSRSAQ